MKPSGAIEPPGLHVLCKSCDEVPAPLTGVDVEAGGKEQRIVLVASVPLSSERWRALEEGELVVIRGGVVDPFLLRLQG